MPLKAPWDDSYGDARINIVANNVLACRVPLDATLYNAAGWTVDAMLAEARALLDPPPSKIMVINLSATDKYYAMRSNDLSVEFAHMLLLLLLLKRWTLQFWRAKASLCTAPTV